jgi:hypothetical protein
MSQFATVTAISPSSETPNPYAPTTGGGFPPQTIPPGLNGSNGSQGATGATGPQGPSGAAAASGAIPSSATTLALPNTLVLRDGTGATNLTGLNITTNATKSGALTVLSGASNYAVSIEIGRFSSDSDIGIAASAGQYVSDSTPGDLIIRGNNLALRFGIGSGTTSLRVFNSGTTTTATTGAVVVNGGISVSGTMFANNAVIYNNGSVAINGAASSGFLYSGYPTLGEGIQLGYNFYYANGASTATIPNIAAGTSRIAATPGTIQLGANTTANTAPTMILQVSNTSITAINGGSFVGPLTGNVTGNTSGSAATITGLLIAANVPAGLITNAMLATASASNTPSTVALRDGSGSLFAYGLILNSNGNIVNGIINATSGNVASQASIRLGRAVYDLEIGASAGANQYLTGSVAGDVTFNNVNSGNRILFGAGSATSNVSVAIALSGTAATNTTSGTLTVTGGVGVNGSLYASQLV